MSLFVWHVFRSFSRIFFLWVHVLRYFVMAFFFVLLYSLILSFVGSFFMYVVRSFFLLLFRAFFLSLGFVRSFVISFFLSLFPPFFL